MFKVIILILIILLELIFYFACNLSSKISRKEEENEKVNKNTK